MTDANTQVAADSLLSHTATIVAAFAATNHMNEDALVSVIRRVHGELRQIAVAQAASGAESNVQQAPAVPVKKSITPDYLVCLEDGKKVKMLKRYLMTRYQLTPQQYRAKWGLGADYPMVAPNYAAQRSELAKKIGLGMTPRAAKPVKRGAGRPRKSAA